MVSASKERSGVQYRVKKKRERGKNTVLVS